MGPGGLEGFLPPGLLNSEETRLDSDPDEDPDGEDELEEPLEELEELEDLPEEPSSEVGRDTITVNVNHLTV